MRLMNRMASKIHPCCCTWHSIYLAFIEDQQVSLNSLVWFLMDERLAFDYDLAGCVLLGHSWMRLGCWMAGRLAT